MARSRALLSMRQCTTTASSSCLQAEAALLLWSGPMLPVHQAAHCKNASS